MRMKSDFKIAIKRIVLSLIFLLLLSLGAAGIYNVFRWKDTSGDYFSTVELMYDLPDNSVDVAFFGPSVMYCGVNPAVLWEEKGIAAYNMGIAGQDKEAAYYFIKEFLKKQSPKVVVLSGMLFQIDQYDVQGNVYRNTISMHNSRNYFEVVNAVVPGNDKTGTNTVWDYYLRWPIIHSRYKEITRSDFTGVLENSKTLGYTYGYEGNGDAPLDVYFNQGIVNDISESSKAWVDKLVELSKDEGFELLFVQIPGFLGDGQRADMNGNFKYLDDKGIKYLDLNMHVDEMGYDYVEDMSDGIHPKTPGAYKISTFLSGYLKDNFELEDRRGEEGYGLYDEAAEVWHHEELSHRLSECCYLDNIFELMDGRDGFIYSVTLKCGFDGIESDSAEVLKKYVSSRDWGTLGGTVVFRNSLLSEVMGDKPYTIKLNNSDFLYVKPIVNDNGHFDEVLYGNAKYLSAAGNFLVIYDTVLDRVVLVRDIL